MNNQRHLPFSQNPLQRRLPVLREYALATARRGARTLTLFCLSLSVPFHCGLGGMRSQEGFEVSQTSRSSSYYTIIVANWMLQIPTQVGRWNGEWEEGVCGGNYTFPLFHNYTIPQSHMGATRDHETRRHAERRSAAGMPRLKTNQLRRFAKIAPLPLRLRFAIQNLFSQPMYGGCQSRSIRRNGSEASFASHRSSFPKPPSRTPSHPRHDCGLRWGPPS